MDSKAECPIHGRSKTNVSDSYQLREDSSWNLVPYHIIRYTYYSSDIRSEVGKILNSNIIEFEYLINKIIELLDTPRILTYQNVTKTLNRELSDFLFNLFINNSENIYFDFDTFNKIYPYSNDRFFTDLHYYFTGPSIPNNYGEYRRIEKRLRRLYENTNQIPMNNTWVAIITEGGFLGIFKEALLGFKQVIDSEFTPNEVLKLFPLYFVSHSIFRSEREYSEDGVNTIEVNNCPAEGIMSRLIYLFACNYMIRKKKLSIEAIELFKMEHLKTIKEMEYELKQKLGIVEQ